MLLADRSGIDRVNLVFRSTHRWPRRQPRAQLLAAMGREPAQFHADDQHVRAGRQGHGARLGPVGETSDCSDGRARGSAEQSSRWSQRPTDSPTVAAEERCHRGRAGTELQGSL